LGVGPGPGVGSGTERASPSQTDLARHIREHGFTVDDPNGYSRTWSSRGNPARPSPRRVWYLLSLEAALGQPLPRSGSPTSAYRIERPKALAYAGLDQGLPEPAGQHGPHSGI